MPNSQFPLSRGSRGEEVKVVQQWLNAKFNAGLDADGIFGRLTESALLKYRLTSSVVLLEYNFMKTDLANIVKQRAANAAAMAKNTKYGSTQSPNLA